MKKTFWSVILILISTFAYCQKADLIIGFKPSPPASVVKNYKKGNKAIKSNNYQEGISYLTLSIDEFPTSDAYFNRAAAYYYLGDTCNFCNDLKKASGFYDQEAIKLYNESCTHIAISHNISNTIKEKYPNLKYLEIIHHTCTSDSSVIYVYSLNGSEYKSSEIPETNLTPTFTIVEEMPSFIGGVDAINRFLATNIIYPITATNQRIQGTVYVSFVINGEGFVTNVKILKGIGGGCDEEAMRVVKIMPRWNPGKQKGRPVRVLFNMPIYFKLG